MTNGEIEPGAARQTPPGTQTGSQGRMVPPAKASQGPATPTSSIRTRLFGLALGLTVIAILIILGVAASSASRVIGEAEQTSTRSLQEQIQAYLVQVNQSMAVQSALILDRAVRDVQTVADTTAAIYNGDIPLTPIQTELTVMAEGQAMNGLEDISSIFIPNGIRTQAEQDPELAQAIQRDIELTGYLDLTLKSVKENNPNAAALYLGTSHDVLRYYPNIGLGEVVPADFSVTQRPWYVSSLEGNATRVVPRPIWSPVYFDATGLGLVTTIAEPVYDRQRRLIGVIGLDITLTELQAYLENARLLQSGYSFLLDEQGNAIILPDQGYQDFLGAEPNADNPTPNLPELITTGGEQNPDLERVLSDMQGGESGFEMLNLGGQALFIAYSPVQLGGDPSGASQPADDSGPGWSLASVVPAGEVLGEVMILQQELVRTSQNVIFGQILPIGLAIALIVVVLAWIGTTRLVNPIRKLAVSAEQLGAGEWDKPTPALQEVQARYHDEIGLLAGTLASMADQLKQTIEGLEQRVADRTQQLEYRSLQLQTAAEIARDITLASDLDTLLQGVVDLIGERFGFYNVGIFLVDEMGEYAQLKVASGELGARLRQRDIRLRVGQQGMVGYVTLFGQPRLSDDVRSDQMYVPEPLLSDTRSELTLPLRSGPKIIGALDVQSTQPAAFTQDDLTALQTLADQLATAIENIRLVTQVQSALQETNQLVQSQTRLNWERLVADHGAMGFEYDLLEVRPAIHSIDLTTDLSLAPSQELRRGPLRIPVKLRDQVIGAIVLESQDPNHVWSQDEITIAEATANQAGLTIENARLLAESQRRAQREQLAAEVTGRLRASLDMETVLQTAVREIALRLGIAQVEVQLRQASANPPDHKDNDATD